MSLSPPKPMLLAPGYKLDRYELLCPIAQGGMASVWIARLQGKHGFEKLVAIKTILTQYASDERFQQMFLDEARISSGIEHTNVAQIMDLGEEHNVLYLVMEWVDGDSLSKLKRAVDRKGVAMPPGIVLRIIADTCGGLHAAHELKDSQGALLGVVHRDVSPQNILVNTKGVSKLIDFGIAKARDRIAGETNTGLLKGKIQYMAPEQAVGKSLDRRADIWAIGAILYHLFAGKPPYEAENQLATLHLLTQGEPPAPLGPHIPAPISQIVFKALSYSPTTRYSTAAELQSAIELAMFETHVATTTQDVADFVETHLSDRADARKSAVELALKAAAERARVARILSTPSPESNSSDYSSHAVRRRISHPDSDSGSGAADERPTHRPARSHPDVDQGGTPFSETSSITLGSAAIDTSMTPGTSPRRRAIISAAVAGSVGLAAAIGLISVVSNRGDVKPTATAPNASQAIGSASSSASAAKIEVAPQFPLAVPTATSSAETGLLGPDSKPRPSADPVPRTISAPPTPKTSVYSPPVPKLTAPTPPTKPPPTTKKDDDDGF